MSYAYCLFCNTSKRNALATALRERLAAEVICPRIIQRKWVRGTALEVPHDYLPGYVFLFSEAPLTDFSAVYRLEDVYRVLGNRDEGYVLAGDDLAFAEMLRGCGGVIGVMKAYRVGDRVRLVEGAMGKVAGEIIRLDRRNRALVRFGFDGAAIQSWVAIDMIDGPADAAPGR